MKKYFCCDLKFDLDLNKLLTTTISLNRKKDLPTAATWVKKYGEKPLIYDKDLKVAYNSVTQLGAEFTGGKYESLLKNKKRKTLNDDELGFLN